MSQKRSSSELDRESHHKSSRSKSEKGEKSERSEKSERRNDKGKGREKTDRREKSERSENSEQGEKGDKGEKVEKSQKANPSSSNKKQKRTGIGSNFLSEDVSDSSMPPRDKKNPPKKGKGGFNEKQQSIIRMFEKEKIEEEKRARTEKLTKIRKQTFEDSDEEKESEKGEKIEHVDGEEVELEEESEEEIPIEPFNLTQERERGVFDSNGNYTLKRKDERVVDAWLSEYDDNIAYSKKRALHKPKPEHKDDKPFEPINLDQQKQTVLQYLKEGETVVQALKRLSRTPETKKDFDTLTEAADLCLSANFYNIYQDTREKIESSVTPTTTHALADSDHEELWEYKAADTGEILGPFTTTQMQLWARQGFFQGNFVVMVREKVEPPAQREFVRSDTIKWNQL